MLDSQPGADGFTSTRVESEALVANRAGDFSLPELSVNWWNTKDRQWQTATLPAETLKVTGSAATPSLAVNLPAPELSQTVKVDQKNYLWQIIAGILTLICVFQSWIIFRTKRSPGITAAQRLQSSTEPQSWRVLQQEIASGEAVKIRKALLKWGQDLLGQDRPMSLKLIAQSANDNDFTAALNALDQQLYSDGSNLDVRELGRLLKKHRGALIRQNGNSDRQLSGLQPLYKSSA